jgi:protein transport protein SEC13
VQNAPGAIWEKKTLGDNYTFPDVVWRVSWSVSGALLAVSSGDNQVTLWKENLDGVFEQVGDVAQQ